MMPFDFSSDYMEGAHPEIIKRLSETNLQKTAGYGSDPYCDSAREKIRDACACPDAKVEFLVGGTQTNAIVITALLSPYQGVIAADSGHVSVHEAGAIEAGGHKVLTLPHKLGKISAEQIRSFCRKYVDDANKDHMVMPGMVYISQPTEYGTLYSLDELTQISEVCREYDLKLYADGARLAYGLACSENDVNLPDMARLCDAFYIGGTKCGALFGEAVVLPDPNLIPHFFTIIKQHGALLAKGRLLGIQFETLFTDDLYSKVGKTAVQAAERIRRAFIRNGYKLAFPSPTNQIFILLNRKEKEKLDRICATSFWENPDEEHTIVRLATSWAASEPEVDAFIGSLPAAKGGSDK